MTVAAAKDPLGRSATMPTEIELEHLCDMHIDLAPPQVVTSPARTQMIFVAERGAIHGERLRGVVLPGGGDWVHMGTTGIGRIDVRATIKTHDDVLISMTNSGVIALGEQGRALYAQGRDVPWDKSYIRSSPLFETGDPRYAWLNETHTVAVNELGPGHVNYRIFAVK